MHVLTVIRYPVGGIRTYLKYTYCHLDPKVYRFTVLTVKLEEARLICQDLKDFDIQYVEIEENYVVVRMLLHLFGILRKNRFDLIHSHGFTAGVIVNLANVFFKVPHILTLHSVFEENGKQGFLNRFKKYILSKIISRSQVINSVTYDAEKNLIRNLPYLSGKEEKLMVIPSGVSIQKVIPSRSHSADIEESIRNLREKRFLFGFLGRFMPEKGFTFLIDAVAQLASDPKFSNQFRILAVNDGAYLGRYRKIIESKQLTDYFIFYGFTADVYGVINQLDAVVVPSLREACGLLSMEAFIIGCPVIATQCTGMREVIAQTPAIKIEKIADPESISRALRDFMSDAERRKREAKAFVPEAIRRFDSRNAASKLDSVFHRLVRESGSEASVVPR